MFWIIFGFVFLFSSLYFVHKAFDDWYSAWEVPVSILCLIVCFLLIAYGSGAFSGLADMTIGEIVSGLFQPLS